MEKREISGIFNLGTGKSSAFNEVAQAVINWNKKGKIEYMDFPEKLKSSYQSFTEADISKLRKAGYKEKFIDITEGVNLYLDTIESWPKNDPS